jgi:hypothetical protein
MKRGWPAVFASLWLAATLPAAAQRQPLPPPPSPPAQMPAATTVPNPFAGFHPGPRDLYQSPDGSDRFRLDSQYPVPPPQLFFPGGGVFYPGPYSVMPYYPVYSELPLGYTASLRPRAVRGRLSLETVPERAQVYVDGFYMGLSEEFGLHGRPLELTVGSHYIELRSMDHETLSFNVMIAANETIRYRGDMRRITAAASSIAAPSIAAAVPARRPVSTSVYVIPKCYAGNKPPAQPLPSGCDRRQLQTRK